MYFRKPVKEMDTENDGEIFSDRTSAYGMIQKVISRRMLPLLIIMLCCVIPNATRAFSGETRIGVMIFWLIMFALYVFLIVYCSIKLLVLKSQMDPDSMK